MRVVSHQNRLIPASFEVVEISFETASRTIKPVLGQRYDVYSSQVMATAECSSPVNVTRLVISSLDRICSSVIR